MLLWSAMAMAQSIDTPEIDSDLAHRALGTRGTQLVEDAGRRVDTPTGGVALGLGWVRAPLVLSYEGANGTERLQAVKSAWVVDVMATWEYDRLRVGVDVPVYASVTSDLGESGGGVGNPALDARFTVLDPQDVAFGLALVARLDFPGTAHRVGVASPRLGYEFALVGDAGSERTRMLFNVGYRGIPQTQLLNVRFDDMLFFRVAGVRTLSESAGVSVEFLGSSVVERAPEPGEPKAAPLPIEGLLGGYLRASNGLQVKAGLGTGITAGIGSPDFRGLVEIGWTSGSDRRDADGDGVVGADDKCADQPEDVDGFEDGDGCPDPDNDGDGIPDINDACPDDPEDMDGKDDEDGCSDLPGRALIRTSDAFGPVTSAILQISGPELDPTSETDLELEPGIYTVVAFSPTHEVLERTFEVESGSDAIVNLVLRRLPPAPLRLQIRGVDGALPEGTRIHVDGRSVRLKDGVIETDAHRGLVPIRVEGTELFGALRLDLDVQSSDPIERDIVLDPPHLRFYGDLVDIVPQPSMNGEALDVAGLAAVDELSVWMEFERRYLKVVIRGPEAITTAMKAALVERGVRERFIDVEAAKATTLAIER